MENSRSEILQRVGETKRQLHQAAGEIGPLHHETIQAPSLVEAHRKLGEKHSQQIKQILAQNLSLPESDRITSQASQSLDFLSHKATELQSSNPLISQTINEYLTCLDSWAQGAGITRQEAAFLQHDNFGCKTILIRTQSGGVLLGHSEEMYQELEEGDVSIVAKDITWTKFDTPDSPEMYAFTAYPQLLPGPAFSLNGNTLFAIDALELKHVMRKGFLANSASWILWRLGNQIDPETTLEKLGQSLDGYAVNIVNFSREKSPQAKKIEFMGDKVFVQTLEDNPGEFLSQSNLISSQNPHRDRYTRLKPNRHSDREEIDYYLGQELAHLAILSALEEKLSQYPNTDVSPQTIKKILGFTGGNDIFPQLSWPYTYATLIAEVTPQSLDLQITSGPLVVGRKDV